MTTFDADNLNTTTQVNNTEITFQLVEFVVNLFYPKWCKTNLHLQPPMIFESLPTKVFI